MTVTPDSCRVGIVDYQAGNVQSIANAIEHLGARAVRVHAAADFAECTHMLLPGVGAFGFCADRLHESGLLASLERWVFEDRKPLLGICVGMQLMASRSDEYGEQSGLDWIGGYVARLPATQPGVRVPHVGWNTVQFGERFGDFAPGASADFYFDHSYAYHAPAHGRTLASCVHGLEFCAVVRRDNIVAAQFHPEKSQGAGLRFLRSFLAG
jgi:imidazole glycerol-phosphate synthase subunit HisH